MGFKDYLPQPGRLREQREELARQASALSEREERARARDVAIARLPRLIEASLTETWDARMTDRMVRRSGLISLDGSLNADGGGEPSDEERLASVAECRHMYYYDPLFARIINLWTDFGFGETMTVVAEDPEAQEVWDEYWEAKRNAKVVGPQRRHILSNRLLVDGELFWVWFVDVKTGLATVRGIYTNQITSLITPPGDPWVTVYYERLWDPKGDGSRSESWWYQDKDATTEDLGTIEVPREVHLAMGEREGTVVYASQFDYPALGRRGWPLMAAGAAWARAYKDFAQDRLALAKAAAMFYRKIAIKGGSRAVDALTDNLNSAFRTSGVYSETNPPAVAGSTMIMGQGFDEETTPYQTGASDADKDGTMTLAMVGIAAGIFSHYLGKGEAYRLATATAMEAPMLRMWGRYQGNWKQEILDHFEFVLDMAERYGKKRFTSREASVTADAILEPDIARLETSLGGLYDRGLVPRRTAVRLAMEGLGVENIDEVMATEFEDGEGLLAPGDEVDAELDAMEEIMEGIASETGIDGKLKLAAEVLLESVRGLRPQKNAE